MSNDKAEILTEAELDSAAKWMPQQVYHDRCISTIRQMAGLLEEISNIECEERLCGVVSGYECEPCKLAEKAEALLARYKGERA